MSAIELDGIREGRKVTVAFCQGGLSICFFRGKFVPRDAKNGRIAWEVRERDPRKSRAFILPTDKIEWFPKRSTIRVDLHGRRVR
jgi:hypothetical protein